MMANKTRLLSVTVLLGGGITALLRLLQNRYGFDADTELPVSSPFSYLLPLFLLLLAGVLAVLVRGFPGETEDTPGEFPDYFSDRSSIPTTLLVAGVLLWVLSGVYALYAGFAITFSRIGMIFGILLAASAACLFPIAIHCRRGKHAPAKPWDVELLLLPVAYLVLRLVFTYRTLSINPILSSYYPELLAVSFLILCLYRASSFAFHNGRTRRFLFYSGLSFALCAATALDGQDLGSLLFYAGGAVFSLSLLLYRMDALRQSGAAPKG